ncbi:hypothetical protein EVAR_81752_1 [Eumeta japonica]|uniref:Uncharacterized protein n=1 Tax=Eumeta variegata TaxID=151549 RepID=A0A4C1UHE6_EUMVA|nr:hypothetical protein EVAR_81752_1 [Eumeta japonica]
MCARATPCAAGGAVGGEKNYEKKIRFLPHQTPRPGDKVTGRRWLSAAQDLTSCKSRGRGEVYVQAWTFSGRNDEASCKGQTGVRATREKVITAAHRYSQSRNNQPRTDLTEWEWPTGILIYQTKHNNESCNFTSVFYESVVSHRRASPFSCYRQIPNSST